jgi:hypothetical protein
MKRIALVFVLAVLIAAVLAGVLIALAPDVAQGIFLEG